MYQAERCPALSEFSVENPLEKLAGRQMSGNRLWRAAVAVFAGYNYVLSIQDVSLDGKTMRQGVRKTRCEMDIPLKAFSPSAKNCGRPLKMLFFPKKLRFTARISTFLSEYGYSRAGGKSVVSLKYVFHRSTFSAVP